uniref:Uncharacterized protein n=1 Tax=Leersia perrieri TaxID=77586 RepID=A0A0D9W413_9ORYZ
MVVAANDGASEVCEIRGKDVQGTTMDGGSLARGRWRGSNNKVERAAFGAGRMRLESRSSSCTEGIGSKRTLRLCLDSCGVGYPMIIAVERIISILTTWLSYRASSRVTGVLPPRHHLRTTKLDVFGKLNALLALYELHTMCGLTDSITNVHDAATEIVGNGCQRVKRFGIKFFALNGTRHVECIYRLVDTDVVKWSVE